MSVANPEFKIGQFDLGLDRESFKGITMEGGMRNHDLPLDKKFHVVSALPHPAPRLYGEGAVKFDRSKGPLREIYGLGRARVFDPDCLRFVVHLEDTRGLPASLFTLFTIPLKLSLQKTFEAEGIECLSSQIIIAKDGVRDIEIKLPLTEEAFLVGHKLASYILEQSNEPPYRDPTPDLGPK